MGVRQQLLAPVLNRLDGIETRLAATEVVVAEVRAQLDAATSRVGALNEQALGLAETETRIARRLEEIGSLLGDSR